jgi:phosphatidylinositol glycan class B
LHLFAAASLFELSRIRKSHDATSPVIRRTHLLLLLSSLPLAFCFTALHCQGQSAVMPYLRETVPVGGTIGFLMPCHSTPWQSALHRSDLEPSGYEGKLWFIGCEPPVL